MQDIAFIFSGCAAPRRTRKLSPRKTNPNALFGFSGTLPLLNCPTPTLPAGKVGVILRACGHILDQPSERAASIEALYRHLGEGMGFDLSIASAFVGWRILRLRDQLKVTARFSLFAMSSLDGVPVLAHHSRFIIKVCNFAAQSRVSDSNLCAYREPLELPRCLPHLGSPIPTLRPL